MRSQVLSIAGYDPSAGAGLLADVKTFEAIKVYGLGVATALTWQNESEFEKVEWQSLEGIISQIQILLRKSKVEHVKIGLVENAQTFTGIVDFLLQNNPKTKIIWDPILKASAGFDFHTTSSLPDWNRNLSKLYLVTPNWIEAQWLAQEDGIKGAERLAAHCHVFLKGGHNQAKPGYDHLFTYNTEPTAHNISLRPKVKNAPPKHGSGCVLSAALTAYLAKGYPLRKACLMAKNYVTKFLTSNETLLGYHKM